MNRKEKYKEKRKGIAKTEYILFEKLNDISDKLDEVIETQNKLSECLYELAKQPTEIFKNDVDDLNKALTLNVYSDISKEAFDEKFKDSIEELEKIIFWRENNE